MHWILVLGRMVNVLKESLGRNLLYPTQDSEWFLCFLDVSILNLYDVFILYVFIALGFFLPVNPNQSLLF